MQLDLALELSSHVYASSIFTYNSLATSASLTFGGNNYPLTIDEEGQVTLEGIEFTDIGISKATRQDQSLSIKINVSQLTANTDQDVDASITLEFHRAGLMIHQKQVGNSHIPFNTLLMQLFELFDGILIPKAA